MPKLNQKTAKAVNEASSDFPLLPDGAYHLRLREVDGDREGPAGPYWSWEFEVVEPGEFINSRLWTNTSLADSAYWKLKEAFDAFGTSTDTDTDDLCGQVCKGIVSTRTIQQGDRKGEQANQIDKLKPADEGFEIPEEAQVSETPDPDEIFT